MQIDATADNLLRQYTFNIDSLSFPCVENSQSPFEELNVSEPRNTFRIQLAGFPAQSIQEPHARCRKCGQHFVKPLELFVRRLCFIGDFRLGRSVSISAESTAGCRRRLG